MSAIPVGGDKLSNYRIDLSSLPVVLRKLWLINPSITVEVKHSAIEGKVVVWSEDHAVRATLRRALISI